MLLDVRPLVMEEAALSLGQSALAILLLVGWGLVFSINYHSLVIAPIERMVSRLRLLARNPMLAVSLIDPHEDATGTVYYGLDAASATPTSPPSSSVLAHLWDGSSNRDDKAMSSHGSKPALLPSAPPNLKLVSVLSSDAANQWYGEQSSPRHRGDSFDAMEGIPPRADKSTFAQAASTRKVVAGIRNNLADAVATVHEGSSRALAQRAARRNPARGESSWKPTWWRPVSPASVASCRWWRERRGPASFHAPCEGDPLTLWCRV